MTIMALHRSTEGSMTATAMTPAPETRSRPGQPELILLLVIATVILQRKAAAMLDIAALQAWSTMFIAVVLQALPFLVFGMLLSAGISTFMSETLLRRALPARAVFAVPVAGLAGAALPGCECSAVPVAGSLIRKGVAPATALTFLLASPAINPVVLASTAVAFPNRPDLVVGRFVASLLAAVVMGWLWTLRGHHIPLHMPARPGDADTGRAWLFLAGLHHDFVHTAGFLVFGAMISAGVNAFAPRRAFDAVVAHEFLAVVALAAFAFLIAMCSEADAFVAASMTAFSDTAKLVFLVVGPAVDVKLAALQSGQFGLRFAAAFAPATFVVAVCAALVTARALL
jgi:uncharacterized membrane protein YraQ (UPF0718 family)